MIFGLNLGRFALLWPPGTQGGTVSLYVPVVTGGNYVEDGSTNILSDGAGNRLTWN